MRAHLLNGTASHCCHHLPSPHASRWWVNEALPVAIIFNIADEWHIVCVLLASCSSAGDDCSSSSYNVACTSVVNLIATGYTLASCSLHWDVVFILVLRASWTLGVLTLATTILGIYELLDSSSSCSPTNDINALFASLSVYHHIIHGPILISPCSYLSRGIWKCLASSNQPRLFLILHLICAWSSSSTFRWEPIIVANLIFQLLSIISAPSIDPLLIFIGVAASISVVSHGTLTSSHAA